MDIMDIITLKPGAMLRSTQPIDALNAMRRKPSEDPDTPRDVGDVPPAGPADGEPYLLAAGKAMHFIAVYEGHVRVQVLVSDDKLVALFIPLDALPGLSLVQSQN